MYALERNLILMFLHICRNCETALINNCLIMLIILVCGIVVFICFCSIARMFSSSSSSFSFVSLACPSCCVSDIIVCIHVNLTCQCHPTMATQAKLANHLFTHEQIVIVTRAVFGMNKKRNKSNKSE